MLVHELVRRLKLLARILHVGQTLLGADGTPDAFSLEKVCFGRKIAGSTEHGMITPYAAVEMPIKHIHQR